MTPSYPAQAEYPVRRGLSIPLLMSLEILDRRLSLSSGGHSADPLPGDDDRMRFRVLAAPIAPEACMNIVPREKREQGMPGARCTRGLVCKTAQGNAHTSIQVQTEQSGIPCAMALRLMPCSPRRRIRLVAVAAGLMADRIRLDRISHRQLDTSNGCRDHTVLPYATNAVRLARRSSLTGDPPCDRLARRRCRVHHIPSRVRDDSRSAPVAGLGWRVLIADLGPPRRELFLRKGLDAANRVERIQQIGVFERLLSVAKLLDREPHDN
jgi:hypothetical protein